MKQTKNKLVETKRRNADYSLLEACKAFEPASPECINGTSGNISFELFPYKSIETYKAFYDYISAPMLLARLCAGFTGLQLSVGGQENYKTTWDVALKHKKSGLIVTFYDYKGAPSIGSNYDASKNKVFLKDVKALVKALTNERFPHPYDGCVVGEVA